MAEPDSESYRSGLPEPVAGVWTELGLVPEAEIHGGFQSKVYRASGRSGPLIVKLMEAGDADEVLRRRVEITRRLADINPAVVGPLMSRADSVVRVDRWNVVRYPLIEGTRLDIGDRADVETMATTLAGLHASLATLTNVGLPSVAALGGQTEGVPGRGQLIHGDYGTANLIVTSSGLKVIDFDECGQGSVEFEIGNTLYMVLFDAWHTGTPDRYARFRSWFVDAYRRAASIDIAPAELDRAIRTRVRALDRWLATPAEAPVGIRTSSPEWRVQLARFVTEVDRAIS